MTDTEVLYAHRIEVVHASPAQKYLRRTVGTYLGRDADGAYRVSLRPVHGSTSIPAAWVTEARRVAESEPVVVNERVR